MKHIGNLEIKQGDTTDYSKLTEVTGDLYIRSHAKLEASALTTVGGGLNIYSNAKLEALTTVGGGLYIYSDAKLEAKKAKYNQKCAQKEVLRAFERQGYILADGILQKIVSKKKTATLTVWKAQKLASNEISYVIYDGDNFSHGETVKQAKNDLIFKLTSRDTSEFKKWKLDTKKPLKQVILAYRSITGACEFGVKQFCESQKLKSKYSVKEVLKLTKGQYGHEKFREFYNV